MEMVAILRRQAEILRKVSRAFDAPSDRAKLLSLAARCDELAEEAEREVSPERRGRLRRIS